MTISIFDLLMLIMVHTAADFFLQTRRQGEGKSKDSTILVEHTMIYSLCFLVLTFNPVFIAITFVAHTITDFLTSKVSTYYWSRGNKYGFFATIGVDQALHIAQLAVTWSLVANI